MVSATLTFGTELTMEAEPSKMRVFVYRIFGKLHQLFQICVHFIFKCVNCCYSEPLPPIDNYLLLDSAMSLASKIRKQKIKSVDLVKAYISRIEAVNPIINAVVGKRFTQALEEARRVDDLISSNVKSAEELERETPFLGVPFTSKEIISVEGMPETGGTLSRKTEIAQKNAEAVRLMRKAGAIPIAVTNTSELAMWIESHNKVHGRSNNPYSVSRTVGGSTGGEGAIIAASGSVIGLGNDIAGSIRIPSCFNGIFGHKPTAGVVSNENCFRVLNKELLCYIGLGPMCRYATDLLPMLKVLIMNEAIDRLKLDVPVKLENLKVYYMEDAGDYGLYTKVHPDIKIAMAKVLKHFEHAYKIKPQKLDLKIMRDAITAYNNKIHEKGGFQLAKAMSDNEEPLNLGIELLLWCIGQSKHTLHTICVGLSDNFTGRKYRSSLNPPRDHCEETLEIFQNLLWEDAIFLIPTWPEPAPYHHEMLFKPLNMAYTCLFNVLGLPVTHCPLGLSGEGLPIGVQAVSNHYNDRVCIAVAVELEKVFGGWVPPCPTID